MKLQIKIRIIIKCLLMVLSELAFLTMLLKALLCPPQAKSEQQACFQPKYWYNKVAKLNNS